MPAATATERAVLACAAQVAEEHGLVLGAEGFVSKSGVRWTLDELAIVVSARLGYNPDQPRDEHGRFGEGSGASASKEAPGTATPEQFVSSFDHAFAGSPYSAMVTHYTAQEIRDGNMTPLLTNNGQTGMLIHDHGDGRIEATALFNASDVPGAGVALLRDGIDNHGVNYVECYGPYLPEVYASLGFADSATSSFDPSQAAADWNADRFDAPDYHVMNLR